MNQNFRFNNPKQCSNWIIFVLFCSSHLAIKNCYNVHFMKIQKLMQKSISPQKVCVLQRRACNKFKRNYLENYHDSEHAVKTKNAPFFMNFPNISFFHMIVTDWTGPLSQNLSTNRQTQYTKIS